MSTRGLYGIRKNGGDKLTYNHSDSYPDWLGKEIATFCVMNSVEDMSEIFDNIEMVNEDAQPTEAQVKECIRLGYFKGKASDANTKDWYWLLRDVQGDIGALSNATLQKFYMIDDHGFIQDSLFCEYAYIINLDKRVLELYCGFQKVPQPGNRYGEKPNKDGYYPCKLVLEIPLNQVAPVNKTVKNMIQACRREDD